MIPDTSADGRQYGMIFSFIPLCCYAGHFPIVAICEGEAWRVGIGGMRWTTKITKRQLAWNPIPSAECTGPSWCRAFQLLQTSDNFFSNLHAK